MKWKWTVPYVCACVALVFGAGMTTAQNECESEQPKTNQNTTNYSNAVPYNVSVEQKINETCLDNKADSLCNAYMSNMLHAQAKLHPLMGRSGYRAAVRAELPGAPVGKHCVYGQYTHLNRALSEMGDTLTIIPKGAHASCIGFKYHMDKKYNTPDFLNCIYDGVMHESDSSYNAAFDKYLLRKKVNSDVPDSVLFEHMKKFASCNFCADGLNAGTILIVPRHHGSRNQFHAVMYLGRGMINHGRFVADSAGRHMYVGHNRENMGDLFKTYDMSNVFAADTREIVRAEYANELKRIESMDLPDLINYLSDGETPTSMLGAYPRATLVRMARNRYFNRPDTGIDGPLAYGLSIPEIKLTPGLILNLKTNQKSM